MKPFEYHEPATLKDACKIIAKHKSKACILAGGTDVVIQMKKNALSPKHVVNIKKLRELNGIIESENGLNIGSATTLADIAGSPKLKTKLPMISEAARLVGSAQVRNLATIGGNICNAAPSADMAPGLLALEATVVISGTEGNRNLPLKNFFFGSWKG
jgi:carbon-monoxide dehydrogenase medium subunit